MIIYPDFYSKVLFDTSNKLYRSYYAH